MGKTGKLEQFSLSELFQLIDATRATGGLLVKAVDGIGTVNFHQGEIVYVGVEGAKLRLGERMVEEGVISLDQLRSMLQLQQRLKPWKPLGVLCMENQLIKPEQLQQVVHHQMVNLLKDLLAWQQGIFKFEPGEVTISDPISLSYFDFMIYACEANAMMMPQVEIHDEPFVVADFEKIIPEVERRLTDWRDEFGLNQDTQLYNRLVRYQTISRLLRQSNYRISRHLLTSEVLALLVDLKAEKIFCWLNSFGTYNSVHLHEPEAIKKGVKLDRQLFTPGKCGSFQIAADLGGDVLTLPVANRPLFAIGVAATAPTQSNASLDQFAASLRQLGIALNLAVLFT
jgi:hypothetical protein